MNRKAPMLGALGAARARGISVAQLAARYLLWAKTIYNDSEYASINSAMEVFKQENGPYRANHMGPIQLGEARELMILKDWNRKHINQQIHRVCAVFKWGVAYGLVPVTVYESMKCLTALKRGRTIAPESEPVLPVEASHVLAVHKFVSRQVWAAIELQRLTGSRSTEILELKPKHIDRSSPIWRTVKEDHKTAHKRKKRTLFFGPQAQVILREWLLRPDDQFLFSPQEAEEERVREKTAARVTPARTGNQATGKRRKVGKRYTADSYRRAIERACKRAGIASWHPHQLRHKAATDIRKRFGLVESQVILGHSSAVVTDAVYAVRDAGLAEKIMQEMG